MQTCSQKQKLYITSAVRVLLPVYAIIHFFPSLSKFRWIEGVGYLWYGQVLLKREVFDILHFWHVE
jgi:hypothetical protein